MKKITLLILMMISSFVVAQQVVVQNFETPASYTFAGFEGLSSASIAMDPVVGGTRMNTLRLISQSTGNPWQGAEVLQQTTLIKLTTVKTVSIDVYATQAFTLLAKVEVGGPNSAAAQSYTTPNTWQTLTFTFTQNLDGTQTANGNYQKIVFFPNWNPTNAGFLPPGNFTVYVDNITSEATPIAPAGPTTAAPTPPARPAADVLSFFSAAYATAPVTTWGADWGPEATPITDVTIATNATKRANMTAGKTFFGIVLTNYNDLSSFTHFHIDYWFPSPVLTGQVLSFKLSNHATQSGETSAIQTLPTPQAGSWISVDVPLADFTAAAANGITLRNFIKEIVVSGARADNSQPLDFYFDNLYFHKNTVLSVSSFEQSNIKMYPNPAASNFTIEAQSVVENVTVYNMLGQEVLSKSPNTQQTTVDISTLKVGVYIVKATINGVASSTRLVKE